MEHRIKGNEKTQYIRVGEAVVFHKNAETKRQIRF
jgi:hypothetical protein